MKSKAAILVLTWNFCITILLTSWLDPIYYTTIVADDYRISTGFIVPVFCGMAAILYLFYPLAGCLADIKCGRYKSIVYSLCFIPWSLLLLGGGIVFLCFWSVPVGSSGDVNDWAGSQWATIGCIGLVIVVIIAVLTCYTTFSANIIQFGMDQLHDSPTEDSVLFVHWFVFASYLGFMVFKATWIEIGLSGILAGAVALLGLITLVVSLCIVRCKRRWFLIDSGARNPYKLVYKVVRFATRHKNPIQRSAFTYCEDELPSRLDLGKEKYGGPFSTEQVEDVKVFLGILCILLTLGSVFVGDIARNSLMYGFSAHLRGDSSEDCYLTNFTINNMTFIYCESDFPDDIGYYFISVFRLGILTEILIVILIPVNICLLRPFVYSFIPRMLKRIGVGMVLLLLSLVSLLLIDVIEHKIQPNEVCFLDINLESDDPFRGISRWYLAIPCTLNALGYTFLYTSAYEFICAQSPHAMKGLLIGTFFTAKGVFQLISALITFSFSKWNKTLFLSCGSVYYLINVLIALIGLIAYTWVARKYKYRQRDEPDNIYRYAEEYYDRTLNEHIRDSYDYDNDNDRLNVYTVS